LPIIKKLPLYPLLFAAYPVLALLAFNISQLKVTAALRSLEVAIIGGLIFWLLLNLVIRNWHRSAILVSLFIILFFSYGHVYHILETHAVFGVFLGRHRLLIIFWILLATLGTWLILRKVSDPSKLTASLNFMGIVLIAMPLIQMMFYWVRVSQATSNRVQTSTSAVNVTMVGGKNMPDIYFIVLDAYSRDDVLKEKFGFDNTDFITDLEVLGFYVPRCSQSNYALTQLSITSTLNLDYLERIGERLPGGKIDQVGLPELIKHNEVRSILESLGYKTVAFDNGFPWLDWDDADVRYSWESEGLSKGSASLDINGFEVMLVQDSAALILMDSFTLFDRLFLPLKNSPIDNHRENILYMFDKLQSIPLAVKSPKFVYVHFVAPHGPIVFGPNGESITVEENSVEAFRVGYRDEVTYLNKRILGIVREIINKSKIPPVIIIQGDHGNDIAVNEERMKILNAYYLPGVDYTKISSTITPVNTFRMIFNDYFGGNYPLLEDKSFYSTYNDRFNYERVINDCSFEEDEAR
jgi:hypothetical protein